MAKTVKTKTATKKLPVNKRNQTDRNSLGRFLPGNVANPDGRPKGSANRYAIADLFHALLGVEEQKRKKLLTLYCERAFSDESPTVMLHLVERFLPSLRAVELSGDLESGKKSPEELQQMIDDYNERCDCTTCRKERYEESLKEAEDGRN